MRVPRPKGDHEARRRDVSEAVWRVLTAHGFGGLTMRAVAAELGATTGLLTHYFTGKRELLAHALGLLDARTDAHARRTAGPGLAAVRAMLLDVLPLTEDAVTGHRIWVSSWDTALADPALSAGYARKYGQSRDRLRDLVAEAQRLGELRPGDPGRVAAGALSFTLGLAVQVLFDPRAFPPERQVELLDDHLAALVEPRFPATG
jgi:AcrR family transcriptional regulator